MRHRDLFIGVLGCLILPAGAPAEHLSFFHANRDWVLRAFEALERDARLPETGARAWNFDPFADASALAELEAVRQGLENATSLQDIARFRADLDSLLQRAAATAEHLDALDRRFAGHLRTGLEVTLASDDFEVERVEAWLDSSLVQMHELGENERAALAAGGVLEVFRRVVEPREQNLEVRAWARGSSEPSRTHFVVDPTPDALLRCHLDLTSPRQPANVVRSTLGGSE